MTVITHSDEIDLRNGETMSVEMPTIFYVILFVVSALLLLKTIFRSRKKYNLPPGPRGLPIIGHMHLLDPIPYKSFEKLCNRYGPLISLRLGSFPCIVVSSPELAKEFLNANEIYFASRRVTVASHHVTYDSSGIAFAGYGEFWKFARKKVVSLLLSSRTVNQLQPIRADELKQLVQFVLEKAEAGEPVNLSEEFVKFSNNIICRMTLSLRFSGKNDLAKEARDIAREVTEIFGLLNVSDLIGFMKNVDLQGVLKRAKATRKRFDALMEDILREREEIRKKKKKTTTGNVDGDVDDVKDFLDILLDIAEDESADVALTRNNIKAIALDMFIAGTDTSASATEWAMAELYNNPAVFQKAREEIDSVVGKSRLVEESDVPNLPYLQATVKETFRLHPPIAMVTREARQDCKVLGYDIPKDTMLFVNVWSIGRNPKYWIDPLEFKPERFLDQEDSVEVLDVKGHHYNLLPFGTGRRGCPGIGLALHEVSTVMAAMIQCFDWKLQGNQGEETSKTRLLDMAERPGLTIPKAEPLMLVPVTRLNPLKVS